MKLIRVFISFIAIMSITASATHAVIYKYVDENGVIHYTDSPTTTTANRFRTVGKERTPAKRTLTRKLTRTYGDIIFDKSRKYNISPSLIRAVIEIESNFDPGAVSNKGAIGLMQLMPATAKSLGVYDLYSPEQNIEGGTRYLKYLLKRFDGDLRLALAAYNAGPTAVEKYRSVPPFSETRRYVARVLSLYDGKLHFKVRSLSKGDPIYKIVLNDGSIIFTNSSFYKSGGSGSAASTASSKF